MTPRDIRHRSADTTSTVFALLFLLLFAFGWVLNLCKIAEANGQTETSIYILRVVGALVAPLGAVLGYF